MRTPYRVATTAVAFAAIFPFGMSAADADVVKPEVVQTAWYWADKTVAIGPEVLEPPEQVTGVPAKDLAVAYKGDEDGAPDKVTYLAWDVSSIPLGSSVQQFEFTMQVDDAAGAVQAAPPDYELVACGAIGDFSPAEGGKFSDRPADDCSADVKGKYDATAKTWTFDVAPYAELWAKGDPPSGIGILPAKDSQVPFQVVFKPGDTVKTTVEFTPPAPVVRPTVEPTVPVVAPTVPQVPQQQPPANNVALPPAVPVAQPAPTPAPPAPVVAMPPVRPAVPVARGLAWPERTGLPRAFWGGALAAVLLLGVASLLLGDATVPVEAQRRRTVTRSLRQRQITDRGALPRAAVRVRTV